jgi:hypothetical protein
MEIVAVEGGVLDFNRARRCARIANAALQNPYWERVRTVAAPADPMGSYPLITAVLFLPKTEQQIAKFPFQIGFASPRYVDRTRIATVVLNSHTLFARTPWDVEYLMRCLRPWVAMMTDWYTEHQQGQRAIALQTWRFGSLGILR